MIGFKDLKLSLKIPIITGWILTVLYAGLLSVWLFLTLFGALL